MKFNSDNKVITDTLNRQEALVFIKFLCSEILRHKKDILEAENLIETIEKKFGLEGIV